MRNKFKALWALTAVLAIQSAKGEQLTTGYSMSLSTQQSGPSNFSTSEDGFFAKFDQFQGTLTGVTITFGWSSSYGYYKFYDIGSAQPRDTLVDVAVKSPAFNFALSFPGSTSGTTTVVLPPTAFNQFIGTDFMRFTKTVTSRTVPVYNPGGIDPAGYVAGTTSGSGFVSATYSYVVPEPAAVGILPLIAVVAARPRRR